MSNNPVDPRPAPRRLDYLLSGNSGMGWPAFMHLEPPAPPARKLFPKPLWGATGLFPQLSPAQPFLTRELLILLNLFEPPNPAITSKDPAASACGNPSTSAVLRPGHPDSQARAFQSQTQPQDQGIPAVAGATTWRSGSDVVSIGLQV